MKKSKSISEAVKALGSLIQTLFKKMPALFLVVIYLIDLAIRSYQSAGFSNVYLISIIILFVSICIYITSKSFAETTLSFILGILTVYSIDWEKANFTLFVILYLAYIIFVFYAYSIRLSAKQESILIQAACKLDMDDYKGVYKRIKKISQTDKKFHQLSIIDRSEIIRYLAFRQVIIGEYEEAINVIELIKNVCQISLLDCCEIYYSFYTYCKNKQEPPANIPKEVERMFDKVTTLSVSYFEFFNIFKNTKRILVESKMTYDKYLVEIKMLSFKGYSDNDIIEILKEKYL